MDIATLDKNFSTTAVITEKNCVFHDIKEEPFTIYGLYNAKESGEFMRMPQEIADKVNHCVSYFNKDTSGGRVRFKTNSKYVAIDVKMPYLTYPHQALSGSAGFDLYIFEKGKERYYKTFVPPTRFDGGYKGIIYFENRKPRDITVYFPLYSHVNDVKIGIEKKAVIEKGREYKIKAPVAFYGGSHTQGGCASKPGNSSAGFISRKFDADFINLGFSSGAHGEKLMAEYIATLPMTALIMEYDHNAENADELRNTHYNFIKTVRAKNPDLPIIFTSKHDFYTCSYYVKKQSENVERRKVILESYDRLIEEGDKNVYFIDGKTVFGKDDPFACTVDGVHPNDLGFYRIAEKFAKILNKIFK